MAVIRRHWKLTLLNVLLLLAGAGLLVAYLRPHKATAQTTDVQSLPDLQASAMTGASPKVGLDAVTYSQVQGLRQQLRLENEDLAALGCSQDASQHLLQSLLTWYQSNKAQLTQAQQSERQAAATLQAAIQRVHMGPRSDSLLRQLPQLRQSLTSAIQQEQQIVQQAAAVVVGQLDGSQNEQWKTIRANAAGLRRYRYVALSSAQAKTLGQAMRQYGLDSTAYRAAESTALGTQQDTMEQARQRIAQQMPAVLKAQESVLPVPAGWTADAPPSNLPDGNQD